MSKEIEYVEVTVKVPKALMKFLNDMQACLGSTIKGYLEYNIVDLVRADIDGGTFFEPDDMIERYGLKEIFDC